MYQIMWCHIREDSNLHTPCRANLKSHKELFDFRMLYSIFCENKGSSSLVSDIDRCVIIRKLQNSILNIFPVFVGQREIQTYAELFFRKVAYTRYDVIWSVQ
jgi:hypothetical protein